MALTIDLTPQAEAWITAEAREHGIYPEDVVRMLVDERRQKPNEPLASGLILRPPSLTAAYMRNRLEQEASDDPNEIRQAEEELAALMSSMNEERRRGGSHPVF